MRAQILLLPILVESHWSLLVLERARATVQSFPSASARSQPPALEASYSSDAPAVRTLAEAGVAMPTSPSASALGQPPPPTASPSSDAGASQGIGEAGCSSCRFSHAGCHRCSENRHVSWWNRLLSEEQLIDPCRKRPGMPGRLKESSHEQQTEIRNG